MSLNLYIYCANSPIAFIDPSGHNTIAPMPLPDGSYTDAPQPTLSTDNNEFFLREFLVLKWGPLWNWIENLTGKKLFTGEQLTEEEKYNNAKLALEKLAECLMGMSSGIEIRGAGKVKIPNMVDDVINESLTGAKSSAGNIKSKYTVTADEALGIGDELLGQGYKEVGKAGSGVFEKQVGNQTYRFRMDNNSLMGKHAPNTPHVHVEILDQNRNILVNNHIPFVER